MRRPPRSMTVGSGRKLLLTSFQELSKLWMSSTPGQGFDRLHYLAGQGAAHLLHHPQHHPLPGGDYPASRPRSRRAAITAPTWAFYAFRPHGL